MGLGSSPPVDCVHERDHAGDPVEPVQRWLRQESLQHRARFRQTGRLDDDIVENRNLARLPRVVQGVQRSDEVAFDRAAEAAVLEHDDRVG